MSSSLEGTSPQTSLPRVKENKEAKAEENLSEKREQKKGSTNGAEKKFSLPPIHVKKPRA